MSEQTGLYEGDWVRVEMSYGEMRDVKVERFRDCLGVFLSPQHRVTASFTPLCEMYGRGTGSEDAYMSNFGEYIKNPVPQWMQINRKVGA